MKVVLLSIVLVILSGCASGPKYQIDASWEEDELVEVSIYRTKRLLHSLNPAKPFFYIDDKQVGTLGTGDGITTKVKVGNHFISVKTPFFFMPGHEIARIDHSFEKGKKYYLRYSMDIHGLLYMHSFDFADEKSYLKRE